VCVCDISRLRVNDWDTKSLEISRSHVKILGSREKLHSEETQ